MGNPLHLVEFMINHLTVRALHVPETEPAESQKCKSTLSSEIT